MRWRRRGIKGAGEGAFDRVAKVWHRDKKRGRRYSRFSAVGGGQLVGTLFFFLPLFAEMKMCSYLFPYNFHISFHFPSQDTSPCCPT